ncbi:MAG: alpha/beta hydrolase [Bacteroidales bacterium]|nr:alpha/beta hydrolase [Bacteroidales bacterium]
MKSKIILSVLLIVIFMNGYGQSGEPVTLKTQTGDIYGTLLIPQTSEKVPVALLIAGSGPTDRNGNNPMMKNNALKMLADSLYVHGIASLRYDKRGIAASQAAAPEESKLSFDLFIRDAEGWLHFLKQDKRFNSIIVIGHSQGSLVGMVAAQQNGVTKFISLEGAGEPINNVIRKQLESQPTEVIRESNRILDSLAEGKTVDSVPQFLNSLFRPGVQPFLISWMRYNPQTEINKLQIPVLIIQGTNDIQVGQQDATELANADHRAKLVIINGMNHILKNAPAERNLNFQTYFKPDLPLNGELVKAVVEFIKN